MVLRRLTAFVLTLLTLHLNFLGADFACASHGEHGTNAQAAMASASTSTSAEMRTAHHHASADELAAQPSPSASEEEPCELPAQTTCCQALASCSLVFSAHNDLHAERVLPRRAVIVLGALQSPLSEIVAPEPPPPKA